MKHWLRTHKELILYLLFGAATTLVNWVVYSLLQWFTPLPVTVCNGIAWCAAVAFAFVTNKLYVFESKSRKKTTLIREIVSFVGSRLLTGLLEIFLPGLLIRAGLNGTVFGIEGAAAKAVVTVLVIVLNYVLSKWIVFRK